MGKKIEKLNNLSYNLDDKIGFHININLHNTAVFITISQY